MHHVIWPDVKYCGASCDLTRSEMRYGDGGDLNVNEVRFVIGVV